MVRAKVTALRLEQPGLTEDEQTALHRELDGYLELAERSTQPRRQFLAITHGVSGSGKTHGTQCLVETFGAVRIRSDVERKRLFGLDPLERVDRARTPELYSGDMGRQTYTRLAGLAETIVGAGFSVIVDATFLQRRGRSSFRELADRCSVPFVILDFRAPESDLLERVSRRERRGRDASDADVGVLQQQLRSQEPLAPDELPLTVVVDTSDAQHEARLVAAMSERI